MDIPKVIDEGFYILVDFEYSEKVYKSYHEEDGFFDLLASFKNATPESAFDAVFGIYAFTGYLHEHDFKEGVYSALMYIKDCTPAVKIIKSYEEFELAKEFIKEYEIKFVEIIKEDQIIFYENMPKGTGA